MRAQLVDLALVFLLGICMGRISFPRVRAHRKQDQLSEKIDDRHTTLARIERTRSALLVNGTIGRRRGPLPSRVTGLYGRRICALV
ncbi:hypothetical protein B0H14DRAFT_2994905, partial [Mycena olivaceomarginata]